MLSTIPFEIPAKFATQLAAGELVRYGGILKSVGTGQIVGHLQETGVAQHVLSSLVSSVPTPLSLASNLINAGTGVYTAIQMGQIKAMIATLQTLQVATLGLSMVGVGVSVAGFLYMRKRFNALDGRLDQIINAIHTGFENQRKAALRAQMSRTKGLMQRAEHAKALSNPQSEYREVAAALTDQASYFDGEISVMLSAKAPIPVDLFWQLTQSLMLCNNVRIDCGIRGNELEHTLHTAEKVASEYQGLFNPLTPVSFEDSVESGLNTVKVLRDISDSAVSKPYLIDYLRTRRITGEEYVHALEQEKHNPLLMLRAS
jgi:hypothetical protein